MTANQSKHVLPSRTVCVCVCVSSPQTRDVRQFDMLPLRTHTHTQTRTRAMRWQMARGILYISVQCTCPTSTHCGNGDKSPPPLLPSKRYRGICRRERVTPSTQPRRARGELSRCTTCARVLSLIEMLHRGHLSAPPAHPVFVCVCRPLLIIYRRYGDLSPLIYPMTARVVSPALTTRAAK